MFLEDIQRRQRERLQLRQRIERELAEREPPEGSENGGAQSSILHVALPRDVHARVSALAERVGGKRGIRALTAALLRAALDQAEPAFANGGRQ